MVSLLWDVDDIRHVNFGYVYNLVRYIHLNHSVHVEKASPGVRYLEYSSSVIIMFICRLLKRRRKSLGGLLLMTLSVIAASCVWSPLKFYQKTLLASSVGDSNVVTSSSISDNSNMWSLSVADFSRTALSASTSELAVGVGEATSGGGIYYLFIGYCTIPLRLYILMTQFFDT